MVQQMVTCKPMFKMSSCDPPKKPRCDGVDWARVLMSSCGGLGFGRKGGVAIVLLPQKFLKGTSFKEKKKI